RSNAAVKQRSAEAVSFLLGFKRYPAAQHEILKETLYPVKSGLGQQLLHTRRRDKMDSLHTLLHAAFNFLPFDTGENLLLLPSLDHQLRFCCVQITIGIH